MAEDLELDDDVDDGEVELLLKNSTDTVYPAGVPVVQGGMVFIPKVEIPPGESGDAWSAGKRLMIKDDSVIARLDVLYLSAEARATTKSDSGQLLGYAMAAALATDKAVNVKLNGRLHGKQGQKDKQEKQDKQDKQDRKDQREQEKQDRKDQHGHGHR